MAKSKGKKRAKGKRRKRTQASRADRYVLYEQSVQEPEADIDFAVDAFREEFGRRPHRSGSGSRSTPTATTR